MLSKKNEMMPCDDWRCIKRNWRQKRRMFYYNSHGRPIQILNTRPRNYSAGGMIKGHPNIATPEEDTISSLLEYGSLVIPVSVMKSGVMDGYKGKLFDKKTTDKRRLAHTIVMPEELVVARKYAPAVERYLKTRGITLPLPK